METVHVFAALRQFESREHLRELVDPKYTEGGDMVPSRFMSEIELGDFEPACIEVIHETEPMPLAQLVRDASWAHQWAHLIDSSILATAAICVFAPNTAGHPSGASIPHIGAFPYPGEQRHP